MLCCRLITLSPMGLQYPCENPSSEERAKRKAITRISRRTRPRKKERARTGARSAYLETWRPIYTNKKTGTTSITRRKAWKIYYSRCSPSLHGLKDWWDNSDVTWFLGGHTSDKFFQCKKSRSSLFILEKNEQLFVLIFKI